MNFEIIKEYFEMKGDPMKDYDLFEMSAEPTYIAVTGRKKCGCEITERVYICNLISFVWCKANAPSFKKWRKKKSIKKLIKSHSMSEESILELYKRKNYFGI